MLVDPIDVGADTCVDSRVVGEGAGLSPGHDTGLFSVDGQWAARVTMAGSLLAGRVKGTDLRVEDVQEHSLVHVPAVSLISDVDIYALELVRAWATLPEPAPSGDNGDIVGLGFFTWCWQVDEGDVGASFERSFDLKEGDVVDPRVAGIVFLVRDDFLDAMLRCEVGVLQVNSTGNDFNVRWVFADHAVSSGKDIVLVQD